MKYIIGVDRLDYIKGIPQKLDGLEFFFEEHADMVRKVAMIQVAVPSRERVPEYRDLATRIHQRVDEINAKYGAFRCLRRSFCMTQPILTHHSTGTPSYKPINLFYQPVSFEDLLALYASSDVCLITSIRDGMNLVSYEYIACQKDRHGVLLLSEFAGASERLVGSLLFNPWDKAGTAEAIYRAVTMDMDERAANHQKSEDFVMKNTRYGDHDMNYPSLFHKLTCNDRSAYWAETFVAELSRPGVRR